MKHFSRIEIRNLESHQETVIDLHPGVNVVTGANHVGKSGLLRAIMFVVYNYPTAGFDNMIRWGKTSAVVKIDTYDGCWVLREKGKNINKYVVYDPSQAPEPITFEGFGTDPPEAVGIALGIRPISMGKSDKIFLHFSEQDEPTFMLSKSAPEIARWMYSLTNLEDIQAAIDALNLDYKGRGDSLKEADRRIERLSAELGRFGDVESKESSLRLLMDDLASLQAEEEALAELDEIYRDMMSLKRKALPVKDRIEKLESFLDEEFDLDGLIAEADDLIELAGIAEALDAAIKNVAEARASEATLLKLDKINVDPLIDEADELLSLAELAGEIEDVERRIGRAKRSIEDVEGRIEEQNKITKEIESRASKLRGQACPTCGKPLEGDILEHIMEAS
jgi:DNA repair exonuclease SbcCD ATPase subunit